MLILLRKVIQLSFLFLPRRVEVTVQVVGRVPFASARSWFSLVFSFCPPKATNFVLVKFGEIVYGRVQVNASVEDLKIRLKKCYATPSDNKGIW